MSHLIAQKNTHFIMAPRQMHKNEPPRLVAAAMNACRLSIGKSAVDPPEPLFDVLEAVDFPVPAATNVIMDAIGV